MLLSTGVQKHGLWLLEAPALHSEIDSLLDINIKKKKTTIFVESKANWAKVLHTFNFLFCFLYKKASVG